MRRPWRAEVLWIGASAVFLLAGAAEADETCAIHPSGAPDGLGEAIGLDFGVGSTVITVFAILQEHMLRPWVVADFALDVTITSLDGINHFHGTDVIQLLQTTVVDQSGDLLELAIPWTVDNEPQVVGDVYTICIELVAGTPVAPARCTDFGPFF